MKKLIEHEECFLARVEWHSISLSEPILAGSYFSVGFTMKFTPEGGEMKTIEKIAL